MNDTVFLLTGFPRSGKTTASALLTKLLRPFGAQYIVIPPAGVEHTRNRILSSTHDHLWIVDGWQTYEEAIDLKASTKGRLITIEISRLGTTPIELPMCRTSHVIENNGTIADLERQLGAMARQYYPSAGL